MKHLLLALLFIVLVSVRISAQTTSEAPPDTIYKNQATAHLCAILFPGGGHLYAGDAKNGGLISGLALAAIMTGVMLVEAERESYYETEYGIRIYKTEDEIDKTPIAIGLALGGIAWAVGIFTTSDAVRKANLNPEIVYAGIDSTQLPEWRRRPPPSILPRVVANLLIGPNMSKGVEVRLLFSFR